MGEVERRRDAERRSVQLRPEAAGRGRAVHGAEETAGGEGGEDHGPGGLEIGRERLVEQDVEMEDGKDGPVEDVGVRAEKSQDGAAAEQLVPFPEAVLGRIGPGAGERPSAGSRSRGQLKSVRAEIVLDQAVAVEDLDPVVDDARRPTTSASWNRDGRSP